GHGAHEHGPGAQLRDGYHAGARSSRGHHGRGHRLLRRGVPLYRRAATQVRRAARARYADCRRRNRGGGDRHGCERIEAGRGDPVRDYIYPAFDQVVSELARLRYRTAGEYSAAVTIRTPCGGGIRGGQTHSQSPEGIFTHVSGIKVVMPSNPYDAKGLLISSIEDEDPVVFFEPKRLYNGPFDGDPHKPAVPWSTHPKGAVPEGYYKVSLSKAEVFRPGKDVTILAYGTMVNVAEAAVRLAKVDAEIIDVRALAPLDTDTICTSVCKTGRCVIVHEATRYSGFGAHCCGSDAGHGGQMSRYVFKLPDLGEGTVEAEIVIWRVKPGDEVAEDDVLVEVMTEKAAVEVPAPVTGKIVSTTGQPGDMVAVGAELVVLETAGAAATAAAVSARPEAAHPAAAQPAAARPAAPQPAIAAGNGGSAVRAQSGQEKRTLAAVGNGAASADPGRRVLTSPAIRRRAKEAGIDLRQVAGSGPQGRIVRQDFEAYAAARSAARTSSVAAVTSLPAAPVQRPSGGTEEIKVIGLRRLIAQRMSDAKRNIPHFSYVDEVDVTELETLRRHLNTEQQPGAPALTYLPFLALALVRVLEDFP